MSNRSTVLSFIQANPGLTLREILTRTGISPIQQINQILAFYVANGSLRREGRKRNYTYYTATISPSQINSVQPRLSKADSRTDTTLGVASGRLRAIQYIVATIFAAQKALRSLAPEFRWTGLGNLLGDYGELVAIDYYGLSKAPGGADGYDATTSAGKKVQVKTNHSASQIGYRGEADLMLVITVTEDGNWEEVYYEDFKSVKTQSRYSARDNKYMIAVSKLRAMKKGGE